MYQDIFGKDNFFIEIQDHGIAAQRKIMDDLVQISHDVGAPLLAANDSHYTYADEADAHDVLLCIQTGANKSDEDRFQFQSAGVLHQERRPDASAVPRRRYPGRLRQHAADRRARRRRRSSSARSCCRSSRCRRGTTRRATCGSW